MRTGCESLYIYMCSYGFMRIHSALFRCGRVSEVHTMEAEDFVRWTALKKKKKADID